MRLLMALNPISGGKNKADFIKDAELFCHNYGIEFNYFNTTGQDDSNKLKQAIAAHKPDRIVSIGGDGTAMMTALALQGSNTPFGIIPMGSANGMAKELNVPSEFMLAFQDLVTSQIIVPLDVIKVNEDYSMHLGDVGVNAAMVENFAKEKGRGWASYAKHFFDSVKNAKKFDLTITMDGNKYVHQAYSVIIANTRMYGTGAIVNPEGNPHDGKFEIVVVTKADWSGILNLGLTAFDPKALQALEGYASIHSGKEAKIEFALPRLLQLDGEVIGKFKTLDASIIPGGVQYISTNKNAFIKNGKV